MKCKNCKNEFELTRKDKQFCSKKCYLSNYRKKNKRQLDEYDKRWKKANKEKINARRKELRLKNKEEINKKKREYYAKNKDKFKRDPEYYKNYYNNRYKNDPEFRIKVNLRNRLNMAIKKEIKSGSAIKNLGCSVGELKNYLESQFQTGMSWDNYGLHGWHIDHIKPLDSFDLTNPEEFKKACNYKNLQPLWAEDNLKKGSTE